MRSPLTFEPIFMERVWGGRRLESEFRKKLPANRRIGESWEIVDRPEAQSLVASGPLKGKTLHELWTQHREEIFGKLPVSERFPLLIKLLDAQETLSLQVHPPEEVARTLGGEAKSEFWYVAAAAADAEIFVGLRESMTREEFKHVLERETVAGSVHKIRVQKGDAMFLPAGRFHAVGAGNLLVEVQQNSDTTYRVFDWNRGGDAGKMRKLHVDEALQSIDFADATPGLVEAKGELLIHHQLFEIQKWNLDSSREVASRGQFAIVCCLSGSLKCGEVDLAPGEFFLVPASLEDRLIKPRTKGTTLLRVTVPS
jgi:mannose-6-phosphate isomerase